MTASTGPVSTGSAGPSTPDGAAPAYDNDKLDPAVLKVAGVVVLGVVMAIVDVTVVNVALQALSQAFKTSLDAIQWVATGYMLALATVIPVTAWACQRFGTKRLYMLSIFMFLIGSILAGIAWNIESLIFFRVIQGLGGGMLMPAGMTIMTQAAGPDSGRPRDGRARRADAARPDRRPDPRRLAGRLVQLALDLLHQRADRHRGARAGVAGAAQGQAGGREAFDFPGMLMLSPGWRC